MDSFAITQSMDAVKVVHDRYQILKDTMGIRILKIQYKPRDSSAMHSHPDNVLYVIDGAKIEYTMQDGSKQVRDLTLGITEILPDGTESVKNIGPTTANCYFGRVNRPNNSGSTDAAMDAVKVEPKLYKG